MNQPSNARQTVAVIFIAISLVLTAAVFAIIAFRSLYPQHRYHVPTSSAPAPNPKP